jgi:hypothetical protein
MSIIAIADRTRTLCGNRPIIGATVVALRSRCLLLKSKTAIGWKRSGKVDMRMIAGGLGGGLSWQKTARKA